MRESASDEELLLYRDEKTGLLISGEGSLLFQDTVERTFKPGVVIAAGTAKVNENIHVMYLDCDQEHRLYVQREEDVPKLIGLLRDGLEAHIVISVDYLTDVLRVKHQDFLNRWEQSPGQGCR